MKQNWCCREPWPFARPINERLFTSNWWRNITLHQEQEIYIKQVSPQTASTVARNTRRANALPLARNDQWRSAATILWVKTLTQDHTKMTKFQVDSGAARSTQWPADYKNLSDQPPQTSKARLWRDDDTLIKPVCMASLRCHAKNAVKKVHVDIIEDSPSPLLSAGAGEALELVNAHMKRWSTQLLAWQVCCTVRPWRPTVLSLQP